MTRTLKGDEKEFEFAGNSNCQGKFQRNFDQGEGNLVRVSGEFELSEFELSRFYCILLFLSGCSLFFSQLFPCLLHFLYQEYKKDCCCCCIFCTKRRPFPLKTDRHKLNLQLCRTPVGITEIERSDWANSVSCAGKLNDGYEYICFRFLFLPLFS